jgi:2',3'-cyclic-nucleotide 2'-phosphodiesterase (5'-nucleotidase family)
MMCHSLIIKTKTPFNIIYKLMKHNSFQFTTWFVKVVAASSILSFAACSPAVQHVAQKDLEYLRLDNSFTEVDEKIESIILPFREALMDEMNVVIAVSDTELIKGKPNSTMGNWFADLLLDAARRIHVGRVDFAVQNYGGLRVSSIAKGEITVGNIYELMPFENSLVILQLDGAQTQGLMNRLAEIGGWPISRGTGFTILDGKAVNIQIDGLEFDPEKNYYVALSDYVANGGDNTENLADAPRFETGMPIRDLIITECRNQGKLAIDPTNRIK